VDEQTPKTEVRPEELPSDPLSESTSARERPVVVSVVAAYQWLKALVFVQIFLNFRSAMQHSAAGAPDAGVSAGTGHSVAAFLLLAVAFYFLVLGTGLWNLQKWSVFLIVPIWFLDLSCDFDPQFFGLDRIFQVWPSENLLLLGLALSITDFMSLVFFANRETFRAFNAEEEAKIFWPNWQ
jgi:hypothetical protein